MSPPIRNLPAALILAVAVCLAGDSYGREVDHTYDSLNRLVQSVYTSPGETVTFTYQYDDAGNMTFVQTTGVDSDGDGIPDESDNCPEFPNPGQSDVGGIDLGSPPDGIGDDCQCGDVSGDGFVTTADALIIRRALLVPPTAVMNRPDLCDVGGSTMCSTADPLIVRRALLVPPTAIIMQQCPATLP